MKRMPNINARDFATILNINPYQTAYELLESKIEKKHPFFGNKFTEHGCKYENIAIKMYEKETGNKVDSSQKNIKHPNYDWITGRPDGVIINKKRKRDTDEKSVMIIEVKCPLKKDREEPLTIDNMPIYYWSQCQVYMNMLDCDKTHYIEYYIRPNADEESGKLHYINVERDREWWNKSLPVIKKYRKEMEKYFKEGSLENHPVRLAEKLWETNTFL